MAARELLVDDSEAVAVVLSREEAVRLVTGGVAQLPGELRVVDKAPDPVGGGGGAAGLASLAGRDGLGYRLVLSKLQSRARFMQKETEK